MLKYTGHPLVDIGAATIAAFNNKADLSQLKEQDFAKMADYIASHYVVNPLKSFLNVAFPNSGFTQPAFEKEPQRRQDYAQRVARSYKADVPTLEERCVFTGEPAVAIAFSDKEGFPKGRAFRQHVPMVTGEGVINFYPSGDAGLPVSGLALLCIQAFPLGCAKCGGKLLAVHSDNSDITYRFARKFLQANLRQVNAAMESSSSKLSEAGSSAKTMLIETFIEIEQERLYERQDARPHSVTAYHLSNSGQSNPLDTRNPPLEIYYLPLDLTSFLGAVVSPIYKSEWDGLVRREWQIAKSKKGNSDDSSSKRNWLYEDLFRLPDGIRYFLRRYLLSKRLDFPSWKITELLMKEAIHMDKVLLEEIRQLGDKLGEYVQITGDKRFYGEFFSEKRYDYFRDLLMRVNRKRLKSNEAPIITLDEFFSVFEAEVEGIPRYDRWKLARDLVLIRMTEFLYKAGKLNEFIDAIPDDQEHEDQN